jgi:hypothetical protein
MEHVCGEKVQGKAASRERTWNIGWIYCDPMN